MSKMEDDGRTRVLLKIKDVVEMTGLSKANIYTKLKKGHKYHDPTFPRQIRLGLKSVAWDKAEVEKMD